MPQPMGERIASLEAELRGMRNDVQAFSVEQERTRKRLHELESTTRGMVELDRVSRIDTADRQRRLELRLQLLTVVVAAAALLEPLLYSLAHH